MEPGLLVTHTVPLQMLTLLQTAVEVPERPCCAAHPDPHSRAVVVGTGEPKGRLAGDSALYKQARTQFPIRAMLKKIFFSFLNITSWSLIKEYKTSLGVAAVGVAGQIEATWTAAEFAHASSRQRGPLRGL